jgi:hypothetical protein
MRDKRFVAEHRGGTLKLEQHKQLVMWACECVENVLPLIGDSVDIKLANSIKTAYDWTNENATVGNARNASLDAIGVARLLTDPKEIAVARAVGHAVATPHMADHSLRAADYVLKAIKLSEKSIEIERKWQDEQLPPEIYELVQTAREKMNVIK